MNKKEYPGNPIIISGLRNLIPSIFYLVLLYFTKIEYKMLITVGVIICLYFLVRGIVLIIKGINFNKLYNDPLSQEDVKKLANINKKIDYFIENQKDLAFKVFLVVATILVAYYIFIKIKKGQVYDDFPTFVVIAILGFYLLRRIYYLFKK